MKENVVVFVFTRIFKVLLFFSFPTDWPLCCLILYSGFFRCLSPLSSPTFLGGPSSHCSWVLSPLRAGRGTLSHYLGFRSPPPAFQSPGILLLPFPISRCSPQLPSNRILWMIPGTHLTKTRKGSWSKGKLSWLLRGSKRGKMQKTK